MNEAKIGIIGGSGIYNIEGFEILEERAISTPYGDPSDKIAICQIQDRKVAFLPRHGKNHNLLPTEIPAQANIYALKTLGVETILAISAVGSLKKEIPPLDLVIPSQIIDRTKSRVHSFFGKGVVGHVPFADPFCVKFSEYLYQFISQNSGATVHKGETYLCMEGPLFSTRAESHLYRSWGCGVIGMTALPESKLAREAEICYALIAMSTDYDCWNEEHDSVTNDMVLENMSHNVKTVKSFLGQLLIQLPDLSSCSCRTAVRHSIATRVDRIPSARKKELEFFYGKYFAS